MYKQNNPMPMVFLCLLGSPVINATHVDHEKPDLLAVGSWDADTCRRDRCILYACNFFFPDLSTRESTFEH